MIVCIAHAKVGYRQAIHRNPGLEAKDSVGEEAARAGSEGAVRRLEALRLVTYKLDRLGGHVDATHRLLQDLRTLRRLLRGERQSVDEAPAFPTENAPRSHKSDAAAS